MCMAGLTPLGSSPAYVCVYVHMHMCTEPSLGEELQAEHTYTSYALSHMHMCTEPSLGEELQAEQ